MLRLYGQSSRDDEYCLCCEYHSKPCKGYAEAYGYRVTLFGRFFQIA